MRLETLNQFDHVQGTKNAPVKLVEYGDYQCPFCGQAHYIVKELQKDLGRKLNVVFRNYPLQDLHSYALHAAMAAETAALQGKFWEMHDILFANQRKLDDAALMKYAEEIKLDIQQFKKDFNSARVTEKVQADIQSGNDADVEGTPAFFVNGEFFDGNWTSSELLEYLKSL